MNRNSLRYHLPSASFASAALGFVAIVVAAFIYFGVYNIAADAPHTRPIRAMLENLRDRSIAVRARDITPPADFGSALQVSTGAGFYADMCSGCHLGPGIPPTEISQGLYPQAPELAKANDLSPAQQFWIIKHGIKLSAMPAWGKTHPDPLIWGMVAFIRKMPTSSPDTYRKLVASAPADHDEMMKYMPGMK